MTKDKDSEGSSAVVDHDGGTQRRALGGDARIEVTIRYGWFGEKSQTVVAPISESLRRELMCGVELSDNPLALILASPGLFGGYGNAVTIRERTFKMRREVADDIGRRIAQKLIKLFGVADKSDGYSAPEARANTTDATADTETTAKP